jgi:galactose mutarotase-like enzyme
VDGASYVETADSGGYDECFPTVGPCSMPRAVPRYAGLALPDHGELWAQHVSCRTEATARGSRAVTEWGGRRLPYRFARTVEVGPARAVAMRYAVTNDGAERLPFLWSSHPLLPLTPDTRLELPEGARVRVYAQHGIDLGGARAEGEWPRLRGDGGVANFARPDAVAPAYACKLFLDMPLGRAAIVQRGATLEVGFDTRAVPNFGVWINRRGWTPFAGGEPYYNLAFEPCIGAPDTLSDALGEWDAAHWLEPGETREWNLTWRAAPADPEGC